MAAPILPLVLASAPEGAAGPHAHFGRGAVPFRRPA